MIQKGIPQVAKVVEYRDREDDGKIALYKDVNVKGDDPCYLEFRESNVRKLGYRNRVYLCQPAIPGNFSIEEFVLDKTEDDCESTLYDSVPLKVTFH